MSQKVLVSELVRVFRSMLSEDDTDFFTSENVMDWLSLGQTVLFEDAPFTSQGLWELDDTSTMAGMLCHLLDPGCAIPTGVSVRDTSERAWPLDFYEPDEFDRIRRGADSRGTPRAYTARIGKDGPFIEWFPAMSSSFSLSVTGYRPPEPMTELTAEVDLPRHLVPVLIRYALVCAKQKDEELKQAENHSAFFADDLAKAAERRMQLQADQANKVRYGRGLRWPRRIGGFFP